MLDFLIWIALTLSIGTSVLAVWVFYTLINYGGIGVNSFNELELGIAIAILGIVVIALVGFIIKKLR